ncbi:MAG: Tol biopolymer transport system component/C-terminal processing protease CtpA/Prc [Alphaproteobacteria bacterium]|jgi:Tol biopolymer transport system component/C-terminal processing protease CtpA/Prc
MKTLLAVIILMSFCFTAVAQVTPQWVRYPVISPNGETIAFTYRGDIYSVPSSGGQATRLTFHKAHDFKAVWSQDSQQLAFASNRFGNFDVFVMDALGGKAKRLTFHASNEEPYTFTADQEILFKGQRMDTAQHRQYPTSRQHELYSVSVEGGRVDQVLSLALEDVKINSAGDQFIYHDNKGSENQWRKHHESAITRDIWTYDVNSGKHSKVTSFEGEDRTPIYTDNNKSIYYLSEQSGSFNIHSLNLNRPSRNKQLTEFDLHPVRFLSKGTKQSKDILAFSYHGELYTMIPGDAPKPVTLSIRTQDIDNSEEMASINGDITDMALSPSGKEIAYISNGEVFVSSSDGAFTKQITSTASQENFITFSPEGDYLLYAAERDNKWSIFKASKAREEEPFFYAATLITEQPLVSNNADNYQPVISPDGKKLAFIEDRRTLKVMDLDSSKTTVLVKPENMIHMRDGDQTFSWSPDSEWILFEYNKLLNNADIAMVNVSGEQDMKVIIPSGYYDAAPKWVNEGKQIIWFSNRDGLKSYATSGRSQYDIYTLLFTQTDWDKFTLSEDDFALLEAIEEADEETTQDEKSDDEASDEDKKSDKKEEIAVEPIEIEWDDLDDRTSKLTIHSSILADAVLNKDATKLYYLSRFEDQFDLWETDLRTKDTSKTISLGSSAGSLMWDPDMETLYLLSDGNITKLLVEDGTSEGVAISGEVLIDQDALRQQSFDHVWLRTSKIFYEPTFHGIDWLQMRTEYKPKVAHVANSYEFTELLSEMLGELNVSHAGAGFRGNNNGGDDTASLGVFYDYAHKGDGVKITEIINGGPLDKAKFDVKAGMLILKIDGKTITDSIDWPELLNRKAGKFTLLEILDNATGKTKLITVKPISNSKQSDLLYDRFVKINEQEVLETSKGKLGYVHIPGMGDGPYRSIYSDMMGRFYDKEAMVIDTRFNGGGDLVADLAMFFTGETFLTYAIEGKVVGGEPTSRYTKPVITLFNESMYSDGHCYASGFTDLKLGKSVGMPVPGTCSFAGWEALPMGGYWGVVPISAKNKKGEWLENNETAPDIEVKNQPGVIDAGRDQQLERAVKEMLKDL